MGARSVVKMILALTLSLLVPHQADAVLKKLLASDGSAGDRFGSSVSISGNTAVIGAWGDDNYAGSAYVFVRSETDWIQQAKLIASDRSSNDYFGCSVSVSGDTILIGASDNDSIGLDAGAAYVFVRSETGWTQQAKLTPPDGESGAGLDKFGTAVSVDGDTAVIGAPADYWGTSSAYVFVRSGNTWIQQAKLTVTEFDTFGASVSVSGDTAVIAASGNDGKSGWAYVFIRSGNTWTQQTRLAVPDSTDVHRFGWYVSISGNTVVITETASADCPSCTGCAYVFIRSGTIWSQQGKFLGAQNDGFGDGFGWSVSVSGDTSVIGAPADSGKGAIYHFVRSGNVWTKAAKIAVPNDSGADMFGWSVSVSGNTSVIGAWGDDYNGSNSGAAYMYENDNSSKQIKAMPALLHLLLNK